MLQRLSYMLAPKPDVGAMYRYYERDELITLQPDGIYQFTHVHPLYQVLDVRWNKPHKLGLVFYRTAGAIVQKEAVFKPAGTLKTLYDNVFGFQLFKDFEGLAISNHSLPFGEGLYVRELTDWNGTTFSEVWGDVKRFTKVTASPGGGDPGV